MMAMHAKDYYVAPIYPVLFAAGAVAFAGLTRKEWPLIAYAVNFLIVLCVFLLLSKQLQKNRDNLRKGDFSKEPRFSLRDIAILLCLKISSVRQRTRMSSKYFTS